MFRRQPRQIVQESLSWKIPNIKQGCQSSLKCRPFVVLPKKQNKTKLSIRQNILKLLQERILKTLEHISIDNNFLNRTPIPQQTRDRIDKWDCIKLKSFSTAKETVTRLKIQPAEWKKNLCQPYI
jgi:hypothetical protein